MNLLTSAEKYNDFTRQLLEKFYDQKENQNLVLSPFSILMMLAIAADASAGQTREEIIKTIMGDLPFEKAIELIRWLQSLFIQSGALSSANAVCIHHSIEDTIQPEYAEHLKQQLNGELFTSSDIITDVNEWAKEKTNGMIDKIADDSMQNMLMTLMNATAFEGEWTQHYTEYDMVKRIFLNSNGTTTETEMIETTEHEYVENPTFYGFVKPYKDIGFSFMALLPKEESALRTSVSCLSFSDLFVSRTEEEVLVTMPEFTHSFDEDLTDFCESIGIHSVFSDEADFSVLSTLRLSIDAIIHKALIEVNRKGTRAAAVTMSALRSGPIFMDNKIVDLNRPFVYAVMHNETGLPVFAGIVNQL